MGSASFTASVEVQNLAKVDGLVEEEGNDYDSRSDVLDDALEDFFEDDGGR